MSKFIELHVKDGHHVLVNTEDISTVWRFRDGGVLIKLNNSDSDIDIRNRDGLAESYDEVKAMLIAEVEL